MKRMSCKIKCHVPVSNILHLGENIAALCVWFNSGNQMIYEPMYSAQALNRKVEESRNKWSITTVIILQWLVDHHCHNITVQEMRPEPSPESFQ